MSATAEQTITLTLRELESMLREPVRDKRYLETQLGPVVTAYLSWKENEAGAAARTLDQYERDLARMCVMLASRTVHEVTTDDLRAVRDSFPKGSRKRVTAALRDFWRWLYQEGHIDRDPMARVRYPKRESQTVLDVFTAEEEPDSSPDRRRSATASVSRSCSTPGFAPPRSVACESRTSI
jgi:hypothetical protein